MDSSGLRVDGLLIFLLACAAESYNYADLQVDVQAGIPDDAEQARLCVAGVGFREEGAGNGRLAFPGLPPDVNALLTVELLDEAGAVVGRSLPVTLRPEVPYQQTGFEPADGVPCEATGNLAPASEEGLLLVVRFVHSGWEQD